MPAGGLGSAHFQILNGNLNMKIINIKGIVYAF